MFWETRNYKGVFILLFNILTFNTPISWTFKTKIIFMSFVYAVFLMYYLIWQSLILVETITQQAQFIQAYIISLLKLVSIWDPIMQKT